MEISLHRESDFSSIGFTELISLVSLNNTSESEIQSLKTELFNRVRERVLDSCHKIISKAYRTGSNWEYERDDLFQSSFLTAFENLNSFRYDYNWDDEKCEKEFLFWINEIVNNHFVTTKEEKLLAKRNLPQYRKHTISENTAGKVFSISTKINFDRIALKKAVDSFNPMVAEIMMLCLTYRKLNEEHQKHFPDDVLAYLRHKYPQVSDDAFRKAKERAIKKIKSCIIN